ncbi:MAG: ATP-dependent Clp protease proteolytic subunit, partial [Hyphomonas sp.]|nr:ATP-dependent Clp protease proteolytic subunit [Hyphomonas sp.]
ATGKSYEKIKEDTDRDFWMSAQEAVDYGLVGKIVKHRSEIS